MNDLFKKLERRNVIKSSISYLVIGFAILESADILFAAFKIDEHLIRYVFLILLFGLPFWIIFAYIYEWTPAGFRKTDDIDEEKSIYKTTSKKLNNYIIIGLTIAIVLLVVERMINIPDNAANVKKSIAVLPFDNLSKEDDEWFAKGFSEDILIQLSQLNNFHVLSNFTLRNFDVEGKSLKTIGKELGVDYLLIGSVQEASKKLRISCSLIEVESNNQTWTAKFDKTMEDIFSVQTDVAIKVSNSLKSKLSDKEKRQIFLYPTENVAAYNVYLKGREEYNKYNEKGNKKAIEYFKKAINMDPDFGIAYAGLANAYIDGIVNRHTLTIDYLDSAENLSKIALELSQEYAESWKAYGYVQHVKGNADEAIRCYRRALEINPNYPIAISNLAALLNSLGQIDESIIMFHRAIRLNPLSHVYLSNLANLYWYIGMNDEASIILKKALSLNSGHSYVDFSCALWLVHNDQGDSARFYLDKLVKSNSEQSHWNEMAIMLSINYDEELTKKYLENYFHINDYDITINQLIANSLGYLLWEEGKIDSARIWLDPYFDIDEDELLESNDWATMFDLSLNFAIRGEHDKAIFWFEHFLERAIFHNPLSYLKDPRFNKLKHDPRFQDLMIKMESKNIKLRTKLNQANLDLSFLE